MASSLRVLFGEENRLKYDPIDSNTLHDDDEAIDRRSAWSFRVFHYFFGFMMEEAVEDADDSLYRSTLEATTPVWNRVNLVLCAHLFLSSAATAVPVAVSTTLVDNFDDANAPRAAAAAVLGMSLGKFVHGPVTDLFGARRTLVGYNFLVCLSLVLLAASTTFEMVSWALFLIEFFNAVEWPACLVILATHYRGNTSGMFEGGIYVTSLAARTGSLIGLVAFSGPWRWKVLGAAWATLVCCSIAYLYIQDAPDQTNAPQNPVSLMQKWYPDRRGLPSLGMSLRLALMVVRQNVWPSVRRVLHSGQFWVIAIAHTGSLLVRTSDRILGAYLAATSGDIIASRGSALLSFGTVSGLIVAGSLFAHRRERPRKYLVTRLYVATIASIYLLAFLAMPTVGSVFGDSLPFFQGIAIYIAGFGIAVPLYHIPSLIGATYGCDKGTFSAYTDGVANGIASWVWRIVASTVSDGSWGYGWAAVALMILVSALVMVEFMEYYFCRSSRRGGNYETIMFA